MNPYSTTAAATTTTIHRRNNNNNNNILRRWLFQKWFANPCMTILLIGVGIWQVFFWNGPTIIITNTSTSTTTSTNNNKMMVSPQDFQVHLTKKKNGTTTTISSIIMPPKGHNKHPTTKIVGFADSRFKDLAEQWYNDLTKLGYDNHVIGAMDRQLFDEFLGRNNIRVDLVNEFDIRTCEDFQTLSDVGQSTRIRRSLFATRWKYLQKQLQQGKYHILMSDTDNMFVQYWNTSQYFDSPINNKMDIMFAHAGTAPAFPKFVFRQWGFTLCGCLSWWRAATPAVITFVQKIVEKCGCSDDDNNNPCACQCDDQVVLNNIAFKSDHAIQWQHPQQQQQQRNDDKTPVVWKIPQSNADLPFWKDVIYGQGENFNVQVWNRHTAFRGPIDPDLCPNPQENWVTMPITPRLKNRKENKATPHTQKKTLMMQLWNQACGGGSSSGGNTTMTSTTTQ